MSFGRSTSQSGPLVRKPWKRRKMGSRHATIGATLGPCKAPFHAKVRCRQRGSAIMTAGLKRHRLLRDGRGQAVASATRTLQLETEGLSALKAALAGELVDNFAE